MIRNAIAGVLLACAITSTAGIVSIARSAHINASPVIACPTEDSTNCYWDATKHGNGQGRSFFAR